MLQYCYIVSWSDLRFAHKLTALNNLFHILIIEQQLYLYRMLLMLAVI